MAVKDFQSAVKDFHTGIATREWNACAHMECANELHALDILIQKRTAEYSEALLGNKLHADDCKYCKAPQTVLPFKDKGLTFTTKNGPYIIPHLCGSMCHFCGKYTLDERSQEIFDDTKRKIKFGLTPPVSEDISSSSIPKINDRSAAYATIVEYQRKLLETQTTQPVYDTTTDTYMLNLNNARIVEWERIKAVREAAGETNDHTYAFINNLLIEMLIYTTDDERVGHVHVSQVESASGPDDKNSFSYIDNGISIDFEFACNIIVPNKYAIKVDKDTCKLFTYLIGLTASDSLTAYNGLRELCGLPLLRV